MSETIQAVFENGVFRPLTPVLMTERTVVRISIEVTEKTHPALAEVLDLSFDMGSHGTYRREEIYEDRY